MGVNGPPPEGRARERPGEAVPRQQRSAPLARALLAPTAAPQAAALEQTNEDREADRGAKTHTHRDREYTLQRASGRHPDNVDRAHTMARDKTRPFSLSPVTYGKLTYCWDSEIYRTHTHGVQHPFENTDETSEVRTALRDTLSQGASSSSLRPWPSRRSLPGPRESPGRRSKASAASGKPRNT